MTAAEKEEQTMVDLQKFTGDAAAKKRDYSILGKLYGLTQDQIDRLQGTGKYAKKSSGGEEPKRRYRKKAGDSDGSGSSKYYEIDKTPGGKRNQVVKTPYGTK